MNNYERIKSLDIGGMIRFIRNLTNDEYVCSYCNDEECEQSFLNRDYDRCDRGIRQWLESED